MKDVATRTGTWWENPTEPTIDVYASVRLPAPAGDFDTRHRRGAVRLPWEINPDPGERKGDLVEAWICCGCGGVTLDEWGAGARAQLLLTPFPEDPRAATPPRWQVHAPGRGTAGRYAPYWQPDQA